MGLIEAVSGLRRVVSTDYPPRIDTLEDAPVGLSADTRFHLLSCERRREVVDYLHRNGPTTVGDLSESIAAMENDVHPTNLTSQQRKRVYVSLYQTHLPKLAGHAVIDYDKDRGTVAAGDALPELLPILDVV